MPPSDAFGELARYYDRIMDFVDYDRWFFVTTLLAELLPERFVHLDAACGTGTLLKRLRRIGWSSIGTDLSPAMLRAGNIQASAIPVAAADLCAMPFSRSIDYATSLFDSINFLLSIEDITKAFEQVAGCLKEGGIFYFDMVTERMVTDHFEDQEWSEHNGAFSTRWRSSYDRETRIAETEVRVTSGAGGFFRERVYEPTEIEAALRAAGLTLLGVYDAHKWTTPKRKTVRLDYVAVRGDSRELRKAFDKTRAKVRRHLA